MNDQVTPTETNEEKVGTPEGTKKETTEVPSGTEQPTDWEAEAEAAKERELKAIGERDSYQKGMLKYQKKLKAAGIEDSDDEDLDERIDQRLDARESEKEAKKAEAGKDEQIAKLTKDSKKDKEVIRTLQNSPGEGVASGSSADVTPKKEEKEHGFTDVEVAAIRAKFGKNVDLAKAWKNHKKPPVPVPVVTPPATPKV